MENMENMTEKEFSKLKRRDLLELLLSQIQEDERLERRGAAMAARITKQENSLTHLKERLDEKDAQIERLKKRLDDKDAQITVLRDTLERERTSRRIELDEAGSIAEAALRLSGIFEAAQDAADRYLENVKLQAAGSLREEEARETARGSEEAAGIQAAGNLGEEARETAKGSEGPGIQTSAGFREEEQLTGDGQPSDSTSQEVRTDGDS